MSHRSRIKQKKVSEKKPSLELAGPDEPPLPAQIWPFPSGPGLTRFRVTPGQPIEMEAAGQLLGDIDRLALALATGAGPELWACLQMVDPDGALLGKLDKTEIDAIPQKLRGDALRAFHSALWTGLARQNGFLDHMMKIKLVGFGIEKYGETIPQIRPIADDTPSFHYLFIAVLQDVVKDHLKRGGLIPKRHQDADFLPPGQKATTALTADEQGSKGLSSDEYYVATWEAMAEFLGVAEKDEDRGRELARDYTPYVFIWLGTSRLLQDIIGGLITGNPVSRKKRKRGGGFEYIYEKEMRR
jgi:hypothetical protein